MLMCCWWFALLLVYHVRACARSNTHTDTTLCLLFHQPAVFTTIITCASAGVRCEVSLTGCYEVMKCAFYLETQFSPNNSLGAVRKKSWLRNHALELKVHYFSTFGAHIWHRSLQGVKVKVVLVRWFYLSPVITVQLWYFEAKSHTWHP